jgi:PhnB protein
MAITKLNPYLFFNGDADKALATYERALGAKIEGLMRYGQMPGASVSEAMKERVMHSLVHLGNGTLMVSDALPELFGSVGDNVQLVLACDDLDDMRTKFRALAEGGKVTMDLHDTGWGAVFGTLTDAHGVNWMFNHEKKTA